MITIITDYHVHLETGPYELSWLKKYLDTAKEKGITDLGFSEHAYRFKQTKQILFNPWIGKRQTEDIEDYVGLVLDAKKQNLPVKLGIEMDYIPAKEKEIEYFLNQYPFDYVIGSVHWLDDWGFDLAEMKDQWEHKNIITVYKDYFRIIEQLLASNLFDILGHVDVIKVFGHKPLPEAHQDLHRMYDHLVEKVKTADITVEMSTAGLRKPVKELYPEPEIMKRLVKNNIPMVINSDAHHPKDVGAFYEEGINYLKQYGIETIHLFSERKREEVTLG